jgi:hypothetical protein
VTKTGRNTVFICREAPITDWLYIMVMFLKFYELKKIQILAKNSKVLAFDSTEKCQFVTKTDRNTVFIGRGAHILDRLYIMVLYLKFYRF